MQEIVIEDRELSLKTFINGIPKLKLIPKEKRESVLAVVNDSEKNFAIKD